MYGETPGPKRRGTRFVASNDGEFVVGWDHGLVKHELRSGRKTQLTEAYGAGTSVLTPGGRHMLVSDEGCLALLSTSHGEREWSVKQQHSPLSISLDSRCFVSRPHQQPGGLHFWFLDWELEERDPADWDDGAAPYLENFLALCTLHTQVPTKRQPPVLACRRKPKITQADFNQLLRTLGNAGYGWLHPEGVKSKLVEMARAWKGPTSLV